MLRKVITIPIASLLAIFIVFALAWLKFLFTPVINDEQGFRYTVPAGSSIKIVVDDLYDKHIIRHKFFLNLLIYLRHDAPELKAGEFLFQKGATPYKMLNQMLTGTGMVYHTFTIIPGWNFKEVREALLSENNFNHKIQNLSDQELMAYLKHPELSPEGEFFPDTYYYTEGFPDLLILKNAFKTMQNKLHSAWEQRESDLPYHNPYEALIAASLIEKEAYLTEERPIIAGVIINRLRKDMLLQIDPTVIYGMGLNYAGKIHKDDLTANTPYNTYIHKGLPPTPIAMPSFESIISALHPQKHDYLYFVSRGDGSHQFSTNYLEHQKAVILTQKNHPWFFNVGLMRYHWHKSFKYSATLTPKRRVTE